MRNPLTHFLGYYSYARRHHDATNTRHFLWSLREVYWDYFPSRFHKWYDKNVKGKYDDEGNAVC